MAWHLGSLGGKVTPEGGQAMQKEIEQARQEAPPPLAPHEPLMIDYTELAESPPDSPIATEWNFYRHQVGQLLAEGHEGKWVLIKGEQIVGVWETQEQANAVRAQRFPMQPVVLKQIWKREPVFRMGYNRLCRS
jgi:hypothetical protein